MVLSTLLTTSVREDSRRVDFVKDIPALSRSSKGLSASSSRLSPDFIECLLTLPITYEKDCAVQFANEQLSLCIKESDNENISLHSFVEQLVKRLLEHRFECDASQLRVLRIGNKRESGNCLWVQYTDSQQHLIVDGDHIWGTQSLQSIPTGVRTYLTEGVRPPEQSSIGVIPPAFGHPAYLLPFAFQDFYPLPTRRTEVVPNFCFIPDPSFPEQESMDLSFLSNVSSIKRVLLNRHWRLVLEEARFCDYIGASSVEGLVVADSIGVPAMIINKAASIKRVLQYGNGSMGEKHAFGPIEALTKLENYRAPPSLHAPANDVHNVSAAQAIAESFPFELFSSTETTPIGRIPESHRNKTLVIVIGSLRGGEPSWKSMYQHLLDENGADLALMIGNVSSSESSMYQRAKYVWTFPEYEDWSDAIDEIDESQAWRTTLLPHVLKRAGTLGGADGRPGSGAIIYMARYWVSQKLQQLNLTHRYERFVLTRSDYFYTCRQDLSKLDPRYMWVPAGEDYGSGITDRHLVCNGGHILKALAVLPPFVQYPTRMFKNRLNANPESFLKVAWTVQSLWPHQIRRFPRTMFVAAVPGRGRNTVGTHSQ
jgi:hypothetical protein